MRLFKKHGSHGFTLIELLIVISIIAILATIASGNYLNSAKKGRDGGRKSDLKQVKTALQIYYTDHQVFPDEAASNTDIAGCGTGIPAGSPPTAACGGPGSPFVGNGVTYMRALPDEFNYFYDNANDDFVLYTPLEIIDDPSIASSQARCNGNVAFNLLCAGDNFCLCAD